MSDRTLLTVQLVIKELKTLDDWFMFGVTLGVFVSELRKIESAYKGSIERCKVETIQYWLDNNADASWKEVAQALEQIDQLALAAKVKKYLWTTCEQEGEGNSNMGEDPFPPTTANFTTTTITTTTQSSTTLTTPSSLRPSTPLASGSCELAKFEAEIFANANVVRRLISLKGFFSRMFSNAREIFAKCDLSKAQFFLDVFNNTEEYSKCDSFDKILRQLLQRNVIDMFNIDQLQQLIACFNDDKLTAAVEDYEAEKRKFLQDTTVLEFQRAVVSSVEPMLPSGRAVVSIKIPRGLARQLSMKDVEELALEGFQECHKSLVRLHATPGSVVIMWFIRTDLTTKLEQLVHKNAAIFSAKGIKEVTVDGKRVFPVPQLQDVPKFLQGVSGELKSSLKQVYTQFYHQLVDAVSDPHTCQSLTAQLHPMTLISQEKIAQLSSGQDTGGQYLRVLGLEDEPLLLAVLLEKMEEVKPLQELAEQMSASLTESKQNQEQERIDQLPGDNKDLFTQLQCCEEDLKRANELLILREKMISALMSERRKMDTSVEERNRIIEQLEGNVTRLQLQHTDCIDAAVQTISTLGDEKEAGGWFRRNRTLSYKPESEDDDDDKEVTSPADKGGGGGGGSSGDSSNDEQDGSIKRLPKLRHVSCSRRDSDRGLFSEETDFVPDSKLFEYVFVLSLKETTKGSQKKLEPEITYQYPPVSAAAAKDDAIRSIPQFCFPDIDTLNPMTSYTSEHFSFVLTSLEGNRRFGYCRRLLPAGTGPRLPEVYCIISPWGCFELYEKVLDHVEMCRAAVFTFLKAINENPIPRPGRSVRVRALKSLAKGSEMDEFTLTRPPDSRLEHVDLALLYNTLGPKRIIQVTSSLMMERRVILASSRLSTLSSCCHALLALLYPFEWQHTFIPVLPNSLIDFCCSPLPFIIGIHSSMVKQLDHLQIEMEEALVVDVDNQKFVKRFGDETSILPSKVFQYLEHNLGSSVVKTEYSKSSSTGPGRLTKANEVVLNAFMTVFAYFIGDYKQYLKSVGDQSGKKEFQREDFLRSFHHSKSTKRFLEAFQLTQMFNVFIEERENPHKAQTVMEGMFEKRLTEMKERSQDIELFSSEKSRFHFGRKKVLAPVPL